MKEITFKTKDGKLLLLVDIQVYEKEAVLNASYKYTDKCHINIEFSKDKIEVFFQPKEGNIDLEKLVLDYGNELIDQQVRLNTGREFKLIREELVKKAFSSINK